MAKEMISGEELRDNLQEKFTAVVMLVAVGVYLICVCCRC